MIPTVSIVMPVYNEQASVARAIKSVLAQTFADFELIVVDDGSTDESMREVESFKDERIRILKLDHQGFIQALTQGFQQARAPWIARMDSDDIAHPDRLRLQMQFLEEHPECVFVGTAYGFLTPNGRFVAPTEDFDWKYVEPGHITLGGRVFGDPTTVFSRAKAAEVGFYDNDFENENPLWYRLLQQGKGAVLGRVLYYNSWRLGSVSRSNFESNSHMHTKVRLRYDPLNFASVPSTPFPGERMATVSKAKQGVGIFMAAQDKAAARDLALSVWRRWPYDVTATRLILQAMLGLERFRFWREHQPQYCFSHQQESGQ
jgi:glycosyltransferase involved in cell wall biosynthesis